MGSPKFAPLNDGNYESWCLQMQAQLTLKGVWEVVKPEEESELEVAAEEPAEEEHPGNLDDATSEAGGSSASHTAQPPGVITSRTTSRSSGKMAEARALMILHVEVSQLSHMRSDDPREIWINLRRVHRSRGYATQLALKRKFLTGKKAGSQSIQSWVGKVQADAFAMEAAGLKVSDLDMVLALTMGLPDSYSPVIITLDSMRPAQLTFARVVTRLLNEEARQNGGSDQSGTARDSAFAAQAMRKRGINIVCFRCGKKGHFKRDCPNGSETAGAAIDFDAAW